MSNFYSTKNGEKVIFSMRFIFQTQNTSSCNLPSSSHLNSPATLFSLKTRSKKITLSFAVILIHPSRAWISGWGIKTPSWYTMPETIFFSFCFADPNVKESSKQRAPAYTFGGRYKLEFCFNCKHTDWVKCTKKPISDMRRNSMPACQPRMPTTLPDSIREVRNEQNIFMSYKI